MKIEITNLKGENMGPAEIKHEFPSAINPILLKETIEYFENKNRINRAHTQKKGEVSCSKRKRVRQKGTGNSRRGAPNVSHYRGGAKLFGPNGRIYETKIPKKKLKLGLSMIVGYKLHQGELFVCDNFYMDSHKTQNFISCINKFKESKGVQLKKCLFVDNDINRNFNLSCQNIPHATVIKTSSMNTLNVAKHQHVFVTLSALQEIQRRIYGS